MDFVKLNEILKSGTKEELQIFCDQNDLVISDGKIKHKDQKFVKSQIEFWDKRQLVTKILLNSLYGAILNVGSRFNDPRIGQSTTLSGRSIAKHMDSHINMCITGVKDHDGASIIYGDTDSCYFSVWPFVKDQVESGELEWSIEKCIELYNSIADDVNVSFPAFMETNFHCTRDMGAIIKCGREIVGTRGLFIKKKRYAVLMVDKDGKRLDKGNSPGKVKAMGLDLRRSDTPKSIQEFLSSVLLDVLIGETKDNIINQINKFRDSFTSKDPWLKGSPKRVNGLTKYESQLKITRKVNMPGHVRASINWNTLKALNDDHYSKTITDGSKIIVCKLRPNVLGYTSIAYPVDEPHLPKWFKELQFDDEKMEEAVIDKKIHNLLDVLKWKIDSTAVNKSAFNSLFG